MNKTKIVGAGWLMLIPAFVFIIVFSYLPIIQAFLLSLYTGKGANLTFAAFTNYQRLISDQKFWITIGNTLLYAVIEIPIMLILALVIAVLLNNPRLKGRGVYRTCIFLPCVTSLVSYAILFKNIFSSDGIINSILLKLHLVNGPISFILDADWAKFVIIVALIWRYTGYYMIFYLAGLQNIDESIYEAAKLDGCSFFQSLTRITVPLLNPIIFLTSIMALNSTLQLFDEVVNLTNGGPGDATRTISQYIYDLSFTFVPTYGYSATVSYAVFIVIVLITLLQKGVMRNHEK